MPCQVRDSRTDVADKQEKQTGQQTEDSQASFTVDKQGSTTRRTSQLHSAGSRHAGARCISPETKPTIAIRSTASAELVLAIVISCSAAGPRLEPGSNQALPRLDPVYRRSLSTVSCPSPGEFLFGQPGRGYNLTGLLGLAGLGWRLVGVREPATFSPVSDTPPF